MRANSDVAGLLSLTAAEISYLSSAWPASIAERVRAAVGVGNGGPNAIQLAGLGSLIERGLVTESESGYQPETSIEVIMLGLYTGQATIEFSTVVVGVVSSATFFIGPELRLGAVAVPAGRFDFGIYPADVDWIAVLAGGIDEALLPNGNALALMQFRSAAGAVRRIVIGRPGDSGWIVSDSVAQTYEFRPIERTSLEQLLRGALAEVGVLTVEGA